MNPSNLVQQTLSIRTLLQNNTIGIILGERVNIDTAAAALSFYLSLKEAGKNPQIISFREPTVEIGSLVGVNKIKKNFSGNSNRVVVSLPYIKGEIGKVSYKEENDRINFYLTAVEGKSITPYETSDINLIWDGSMPSVVVLFGVNSASQLSSYLGNKDSLKVVTINNSGESFGDISITGNSYSSTSEIVAKILKDLRLPINIDIAQNLLEGILYSTRNFTKNNASPYAFEAAGVLMQLGAIRKDNRNQNRPSFSQPQRLAHQGNSNQPRNHASGNRSNAHALQNSDSFDRKPSRRDEFEKRETLQNSQQELNVNSSDTTDAPRFQDDEVPSDWLTPKVFKGSQSMDDLK